TRPHRSRPPRPRRSRRRAGPPPGPRPVPPPPPGAPPAGHPPRRPRRARPRRRPAPPPPGDDDDLSALAARLHEPRLDRSRPMWEGYLVEGLAGGGFALYGKIHHATLDGMSGIRMLEQSMDSDPERRGMPLLLTPATPEP
ncbi:wax ester/triacylglycerol synthase domain-containing protein, partial [Prescottella defluvii]|uniref:wax ester/triacylglycerol synthase domain-containing protein n=1 Tax=Prescottella defluvii TaxID=1323361 RepID=UPI002F355BBE